jgi:hypothetical protein
LCAALILLAACGGTKETPIPTPTAIPGIAFPRQKPVEGIRTCMEAELAGTLYLDPEGGCLRVRSLSGEELLPIWPPEFTLRAEGEGVLVVDGQGQVAARAGQEVYMGGGYVPVSDEYVLAQIPQACRGAYFVVGCEVRPSLRQDAELLYTDVTSTTGSTVLFPHYTPALDGQVTGGGVIAGELVAYEYRRCLHLQGTGPGAEGTLLWPPDWSARAEDEGVVVVDEEGQVVARLGDEVWLRARGVPHSMDAPVYRQLIDELPSGCIGATWLVDGVE